MPGARPRLADRVVSPPPPLCAPRLAFPPPVSLIPLFRPVVPERPRDMLAERVPEAERDPAPDRFVGCEVVRPAVSSIIPDESSPDLMLSVQSPIWSLRLLSWLLI